MTALHSEGPETGEQGCKTRQRWFLHSLVKKMAVPFSLSQLENLIPPEKRWDAFQKQSLAKSKWIKLIVFLIFFYIPPPPPFFFCFLFFVLTWVHRSAPVLTNGLSGNQARRDHMGNTHELPIHVFKTDYNDYYDYYYVNKYIHAQFLQQWIDFSKIVVYLSNYNRKITTFNNLTQRLWIWLLDLNSKSNLCIQEWSIINVLGGNLR